MRNDTIDVPIKGEKYANIKMDVSGTQREQFSKENKKKKPTFSLPK